VLDLESGRYDRQERIWWWDQESLLRSRVLVVGAGALGNEIVKSLVLVGVGEICVVDMDTIENSNLSRCVFFAPGDEGRKKAEVLAERAAQLNPDSKVTALVQTVQSLGNATPTDFDLVIAGLDNREARIWVNAACRRIGKPWVDGAIEGLQGLVRVFGPQGACYECTLSESDLAALSHRRSCALLTVDDLARGRTPTNATTASIVAGVEVQEAIKILTGNVDLVALRGKVWRYEGESMLTTLVEYVEDGECLAHGDPIEIMELSEKPETFAEICKAIAKSTGEKPLALDFLDDLILVSACSACGAGEDLLGLRSMIASGAGVCGVCEAELPVSARSSLDPSHAWTEIPIRELAWPAAEFVGVRSARRCTFVRVEACA